MACCSKLTDVLPSIQTVGSKLSESALTPIKKAKERWSSPDVNSTIERMKSRTWFGKESDSSILNRVSSNPRRVSDLTPQSPPKPRETEEEFRAFVDDIRRKSGTNICRKSTAEKRRKIADERSHRVTSRFKDVSPKNTPKDEDEVTDVGSGDDGSQMYYQEHCGRQFTLDTADAKPNRASLSPQSMEARPNRLLNRQRTSKPHLRYVPSCTSESETVSSVENRPIGKFDRLMTLYTNGKPTLARLSNRLDAAQGGIECNRHVVSGMCRNNRVSLAENSGSDTVASQTDDASTATDSVETSIKTTSISSIATSTSSSRKGLASDDSISYRDALRYKAADDKPPPYPAVHSSLQQERAGAISITSLLRDASRKSQQGTLKRNSNKASTSSSDFAEKKQDNRPRSRSPSNKLTVPSPLDVRDCLERPTLRSSNMTLDKAALKENRSLHEHPTSSAPDNSAVHTASKNSTPQRMISKKFRASPAKDSQASSRVRTRSRGPLNTPNPKAPEGSRTSRKSRGETEADHPRGSPPNSYHPNTEEKSLSDTDVKTVSVMQAEEEREFMRWVYYKRRRSNRRQPKSNDTSGKDIYGRV